MLGLQGRYADADPLFRQVLAARRRTLGDDHPATPSTAHPLARLIARHARYGAALEMASRALGGRRPPQRAVTPWWRAAARRTSCPTAPRDTPRTTPTSAPCRGRA